MLPIWRSRRCSQPVSRSATLVVLPAALHFFQNFNSSEFNVLVQASQYYKFAATTLLAMGLLFQIPGRDHRGHPRRHRHPPSATTNRRYAVLACGLVAATLPGDAITMLLETLPLYVLFEAQRARSLFDR